MRLGERGTNVPDERETLQVQDDVGPSCEEQGVLPGY